MIRVELEDFIKSARNREVCGNVRLANLLKVEIDCNEFQRCEDCNEYLIKKAKELNFEDENKKMKEVLEKQIKEKIK